MKALPRQLYILTVSGKAAETEKEENNMKFYCHPFIEIEIISVSDVISVSRGFDLKDSGYGDSVEFGMFE